MANIPIGTGRNQFGIDLQGHRSPPVSPEMDPRPDGECEPGQEHGKAEAQQPRVVNRGTRMPLEDADTERQENQNRDRDPDRKGRRVAAPCRLGADGSYEPIDPESDPDHGDDDVDGVHEGSKEIVGGPSFFPGSKLRHTECDFDVVVPLSSLVLLIEGSGDKKGRGTAYRRTRERAERRHGGCLHGVTVAFANLGNPKSVTAPQGAVDFQGRG